MTPLRPQAANIPRPRPSALSKRFWEGCRQEKLLFQRCEECGGSTHTPAVSCARCTSPRLTWEESSGRGSIYSWTTIWRPQVPAFAVPYTAIIVEMSEGWHMVSNLTGCEHDVCHIGLPVKVEFHRLDDETTLPYFVPV